LTAQEVAFDLDSHYKLADTVIVTDVCVV